MLQELSLHHQHALFQDVHPQRYLGPCVIFNLTIANQQLALDPVLSNLTITILNSWA